MKLVNDPEKEDYHMHSSDFSDGKSTIAELVQRAGEDGMKKIVITDHSKAVLDAYRRNWGWIIKPKDRAESRKAWQRTHSNGVEVVLGLEADLLNEEGDICDYNWDPKNHEDWLILSAHGVAYLRDPRKVTQGYINAIKRNEGRIKIIGHPYCSRDFATNTNMRELAKAANDYGVLGEMNGKCFAKTGELIDFMQLDLMLESFDQVVVNSDAHNIKELTEAKRKPFLYLKEQGLVS